MTKIGNRAHLSTMLDIALAFSFFNRDSCLGNNHCIFLWAYSFFYGLQNTIRIVNAVEFEVGRICTSVLRRDMRNEFWNYGMWYYSSFHETAYRLFACAARRQIVLRRAFFSSVIFLVIARYYLELAPVCDASRMQPCVCCMLRGWAFVERSASSRTGVLKVGFAGRW